MRASVILAVLAFIASPVLAATNPLPQNDSLAMPAKDDMDGAKGAYFVPSRGYMHTTDTSESSSQEYPHRLGNAHALAHGHGRKAHHGGAGVHAIAPKLKQTDRKQIVERAQHPRAAGSRPSASPRPFA